MSQAVMESGGRAAHRFARPAKEGCSNRCGHGGTKPEENSPKQDVKAHIESVDTMNPEVVREGIERMAQTGEAVSHGSLPLRLPLVPGVCPQPIPTAIEPLGSIHPSCRASGPVPALGYCPCSCMGDRR